MDLGACEYQPTVTAVSPAQGSEGGGTAVTISGVDLAGATAVEFGNTPATGVGYNSATQQVTATSPPGTGIVDVNVVTPSGTSQVDPPGDQFTYIMTPVFSGVASQTVTYGTPAVTLSGSILLVPDGESVSVTLNGVTQQATVTGGAFSCSFATLGLGVASSPYLVTYTYAGDAGRARPATRVPR